MLFILLSVLLYVLLHLLLRFYSDFLTLCSNLPLILQVLCEFPSHSAGEP